MTDKELAKVFWDNVKKTLKDQNKTRQNFCQHIHIKEKTLSSMICRNQCPNIFLLTLIRNELRMECDQLLYSFDSTSRRVPLSENEKRLIELIRSNPETRQNTIIDAISAVLEYVKNPGEELHIENTPEQQFQPIEVTITEEPPADTSAPVSQAPETEAQSTRPVVEEPQASEVVEQFQTSVSEASIQTAPAETAAPSEQPTRATRRIRSTMQTDGIVQLSLFGSEDFL